MTRAEAKQKKLVLLQLIKEKKNILFGSIQNNEVERNEKVQAWKEILIKAQSLGLANSKRNWNYARDHLFGLWKSRALAKKDDLYKNGSLGKEVKLDVVDEAIFDIMGTDSTRIEDLKLSEADCLIESEILLTGTPHQSVPYNKSDNNSSTNSKQAKKRNAEPDSIDVLKINVLKSKLYKNKLKITKLEKELGVPPSIYTLDIININVNVVNGTNHVNEPDNGMHYCQKCHHLQCHRYK